MLGGSLSEEDVKAIRDWFAGWGGHVAAVNFTAARLLFDEGAVGFGTWMTMVEGLDGLEREQWRSVWPTIEDFQFLLESLKVSVSGDRCMAFAMLHFDSTGIAADGARFPRPGRVTVVFGREDAAQPACSLLPWIPTVTVLFGLSKFKAMRRSLEKFSAA